MDNLDRAIVNAMQGGFPVCERPFAEVAATLGTSERELIARLERLSILGTLTRFGPLFQIERMGGAFSLCAMQVPEADFERVAGIVNAFPEVAHNYAREHVYNMWFVLATERPGEIAAAVERIEAATGCAVLNLPKEHEFFVGLTLHV